MEFGKKKIERKDSANPKFFFKKKLCASDDGRVNAGWQRGKRGLFTSLYMR